MVSPMASSRPLNPGIYVRYFVEIPADFESVGRALLQRPEEWIPGLADGADQRGQRLLMNVGVGVQGHRIEKRVEMHLEHAVRTGSTIRLPFSWRATGPVGLFPVLEGDLEVAPLGGELTQLAVSARYAPPLGLIGRTIDRTLLHRVAEGTVKDFVDRIGLRVADLVSPDRPTITEEGPLDPPRSGPVAGPAPPTGR